MEKNLEHYIVNFKGLINQDLCKQTVKELSKTKFSLHSFYNVKSGNSHSYETDLSVSYKHVSTHTTLMQLCYTGLNEYHKLLNMNWYGGWAGYENLRYNKYKKGTEMRIHCDHIHSLFPGERKGVPILTILGSLNNNYEGGELVLFEDTIIDFKAGDLVIFPSNFLYPHHVNMVTKGTRYSFVSWSW